MQEAETFGLLRAHIRYFNVDKQLRTVLVVSASSGDGKSTVVRNLAVAAATVGSRVLVVEADLRRPTLSDQFGIAPGPGVSEVLLGEVSLDAAVQHVRAGVGGETRARLDVLVAGVLARPTPLRRSRAGP